MITSLSTNIGTQSINGIENTDKDDLFHVNSIVILLFVHIKIFFYVLGKLTYKILNNNEKNNKTKLLSILVNKTA